MELDCGIAKRRIDAWLDVELALEREGARWIFSHEGQSCVVTTGKLENRPLGSVEIERTSLNVEGENAAVDEFMRLFTLRFVSAGG